MIKIKFFFLMLITLCWSIHGMKIVLKMNNQNIEIRKKRKRVDQKPRKRRKLTSDKKFEVSCMIHGCSASFRRRSKKLLVSDLLRHVFCTEKHNLGRMEWVKKCMRDNKYMKVVLGTKTIYSMACPFENCAKQIKTNCLSGIRNHLIDHSFGTKRHNLEGYTEILDYVNEKACEIFNPR